MRIFREGQPFRWRAVSALIVLFAATVCPAEDGDTAGEGVGDALIGITTPSEQAILSSVMPARITAILVPEGGRVQAGDVVVQLDDSVQRARWSIAEAAARVTLAVDLAQAEWDRARTALRRLEGLSSSLSASSKELTDAVAEESVRRLEYELARFNQAQAARAADREKAVLDQHQIRAPFSGYVSEHIRRPGESVDQLRSIVAFQRLDPLMVVVDCPLSMARTVQAAGQAMITPAEDTFEPRLGKVVFINRVADAASQTFRVKISVENDDAEWMAGMSVAVRFVNASNTPRSAR